MVAQFLSFIPLMISVAHATATEAKTMHTGGEAGSEAASLVEVRKSGRVVRDPFGQSQNAMAVPGSVVEYCITVTNRSTEKEITDVGVSDALPKQLEFDASFGVRVAELTLEGHCQSSPNSVGYFAEDTVRANLLSVPAGQTQSVVFRATIR